MSALEALIQRLKYVQLLSVDMPSFLAREKKTKTKRPVKFKTSSGKKVSFKARRRPQRRTRVEW